MRNYSATVLDYDSVHRSGRQHATRTTTIGRHSTFTELQYQAKRWTEHNPYLPQDFNPYRADLRRMVNDSPLFWD